MVDQDETFVVRGPRPDGFTILYNDAAEMLINEHSAVIKCYMALCLMSNGERSAHPSLKILGIKMGDMSVDSARRAVNRLEELDLLYVHRPENQGRGTANTYTLTRPEGLQNKGGMEATLLRKGGNSKSEGLQENPQRVAPAMPPQQVKNNQQNNQPSTSRAREGNDGQIDVGDYEDLGPISEMKGPIQHHPQGARQQAPQRSTPPVSNQMKRCPEGGVYGEDCPFDTLEEEKAHPYWTPANVEYFKALIEPYPVSKLGEQKLSMHAWRTVVGDRASDQAWADAYWKGLHDWIYKWQTEKTLEKDDGKWVPFLANFIKKQKWSDVEQAPGR